ncbi:phage tail tape measure protein, partial [Comamonas jiangduensis]|uniref:phage tail tape measure protein n=1 Tax=Comamonas jiangduensis TaxID=1194168 RepID=UPI003BF80E9D
LNQAQGLATLMDMAKEAEQARSTEIDRQNTLYQLQERLMNAQQQHQLELLTYGMGDQAAAELRERMALEQKQQGELRQMQHEHGQEMRAAETEAERNHLQTLFDERYRLTQEALAEEVRLFDEAAAAKRAKERDGVLGAKSALDTYVRDAQNAYGMTKQVVTSALGGMEDAAVSMITTLKLDYKSLATSIVADITRIIVKQQLANALTAMMGKAGGSDVSGFIGNVLGALTGGGFASGGYTGAGGEYEPAGVVHRGEGVLSQRDVAALGGPRAFEQFRASLHHGYSGGGYVRGYVAPSSPALPAVRPAASAGAQPLVVNVQMPQGASRETALQFGLTVGRQIQLARRNG